MATWIENLVASAQQAARQGRWLDAERFWQQVRAAQPNHPQALYSLGMHAFQKGRLDESLALLRSAQAGSPKDPGIPMAASLVCKAMARPGDEEAFLVAALAIDPYYLPALLGIAGWIERQAGVRQAASHYRNALKVAPVDEAAWPPALAAQLRHAKSVVTQCGEELAQFLAQELGSIPTKLDPYEAARWREVGALVAGTSQSYPSKANRLQIPRLPAVTFFERQHFPWIEALETQTPAIRDEFEQVYAEHSGGFHPYVAYPEGTPVNQWHELNHSKRWSSYFLWQNGAPMMAHQERCPKTVAALAQVQMAEIPQLCPNAMFSALAPRTRIPPHHGETNARLVVHLPLIVPDRCSYRVGFDWISWQEGRVIVFDDSIEHEARNDSDLLRVVLIFDVWNPLLSAGEQEMVRCIHTALERFNAG